MQKVALRKDSMALLFSCNRVIIRFRVVGNGGFTAKYSMLITGWKVVVTVEG